MSYKAQIIEVIQEQNDRTGTSMIAIKKIMQENLPKDKKWLNATFLTALKNGVEKGELVKNKNSYKLSVDYKKKIAKAEKAAAAPKKVVKKPVKKTVKKVVKKPVKKTTTKKKTTSKTKKPTKKTAAKKKTTKKTTSKAKKPTKKTTTKKKTTKK